MNAKIPKEHYSVIKSIDIDSHKTDLRFEYWEANIPESKKKLRAGLETLKKSFKRKKTGWQKVSRSQVVAQINLLDDAGARLLLVMMWGFGAPDGSTAPGYGAFRVKKMFSNYAETVRQVEVCELHIANEDYKEAYGISKNISYLGPNFFTKYLYFYSKSIDKDGCLLIYDDRVAEGLVELFQKNKIAEGLVKISTSTKFDDYQKYVNTLHAWAETIDCEADQIEYFLFQKLYKKETK